MRINNKKELKECLQEDRKYYDRMTSNKIKDIIEKEHLIEIWKYIKYLRKTEYFIYSKKDIVSRLKGIYYTRKKNKLGNKIGFYIPPNVFDKGLTICHHGNIIVNGYAKVGKNCKLHGDNCIGNNGKDKKAPVIGDNVDIGIGAKIIGNVFIANGIKIGANAVVTKSFYDENITIAGIPAVKIQRKEKL